MSGGVPAGWVLVPVEPTQEMLDALARQAQKPTGWHNVYPAMYRAMLSAVPTPTPPIEDQGDSRYGDSGYHPPVAPAKRLGDGYDDMQSSPTPPIEGRDADVGRATVTLDVFLAAYRHRPDHKLARPIADDDLLTWGDLRTILAALQALGERG